MTTPINKPQLVELDANQNYFWCSCGKSQKQPYCDGAHKGSDFKPQKFSPSQSGDFYLCQCKKTQTPPYCDGSHKQL